MVSVRPVNCHMTHGAGMVLLRLIVECRNRRSAGIHREGVALKTEQVDVAAPQQPRIGRSVRHVAGHATLGFYRRVLEREGAGFVGVAVEAKLVLGRGGAKLVGEESAMGIMAVAARQQAFIDLVVKGLGEIRFDVEMAGIAELRLGHLQQLYLHLGSMDGVAIHASDIVFEML